jgi:hypothetical protein
MRPRLFGKYRKGKVKNVVANVLPVAVVEKFNQGRAVTSLYIINNKIQLTAMLPR